MAIPMPCPTCRKAVKSDDRSCPHCGLAEPGKSWRRVIPGLLVLSSESIVRDIIYINVAIYLFAVVFMPISVGTWRNPLSVLSPSEAGLLLFGATGTVPVASAYRWWTLLSANYIHSGLLHLLFNMIALSQIAPLALQAYGPARLVVLYTLGGAAGFLVSWMAAVPFTVGASAAICSLIGATLYHAVIRRGARVPGHIRTLLAWALGMFLFGLVVPGGHNWAHAGGLAGGLGLGGLLGSQERAGETPVHRKLARACGVATLSVLSWGLGNVLFLKLLAAPGALP